MDLLQKNGDRWEQKFSGHGLLSENHSLTNFNSLTCNISTSINIKRKNHLSDLCTLIMEILKNLSYKKEVVLTSLA